MLIYHQKILKPMKSFKTLIYICIWSQKVCKIPYVLHQIFNSQRKTHLHFRSCCCSSNCSCCLCRSSSSSCCCSSYRSRRLCCPCSQGSSSSLRLRSSTCSSGTSCSPCCCPSYFICTWWVLLYLELKYLTFALMGIFHCNGYVEPSQEIDLSSMFPRIKRVHDACIEPLQKGIEDIHSIDSFDFIRPTYFDSKFRTVSGIIKIIRIYHWKNAWSIKYSRTYHDMYDGPGSYNNAGSPLKFKKAASGKRCKFRNSRHHKRYLQHLAHNKFDVIKTFSKAETA